MRSVCRMMLALGLVALLASPALAQQQQRRQGQRGQFGGGGGFGASFLLTNEGVQKELKLTDEQKDKLKEALASVREKQKDLFAGLQDLGQEERLAKMRELGQKSQQLTTDAIKPILNADQMKRLKQIETQFAGSAAFSTPDVQTALKLTDDQKDKIKTINEDADKERRAGGQGNFDPQKFAALRKESIERVTSVLTADQKKAWKDLTGEPFEVRFERRRPN